MTIHPEIWAKSHASEVPYPLVCHLLDTATAMQVIWRNWLRPGLRLVIEKELGKDAEQIAMLVAGLHDIGKANPVFAGQLASSRKDNWIGEVRQQLAELKHAPLRVPPVRASLDILRRHEQVGAASLLGNNLDANQPASSSWLALTALGHHGRFAYDNQQTPQFERFALGTWAETRDSISKHLASACGLSLSSLPREVSPTITTLLSGLVILADRLASQDAAIDRAYHDQAAGELAAGDGASWITIRAPYFHSLLKDTIGLYQDFQDPQAAILGPHSARPMQEQASQVGDGLWFVMTATGSGKTEAALLRHASKAESLTFLLPTQATTNALMRRVQSTYQGTSNVASLAHGLASIEDFYNTPLTASTDEKVGAGLFPTSFVQRGSTRLLAPVCVGTIDQALMGALPLKWTHLRLLALANSHIVIDEAHTLDHYQTKLLESLLWWLGQTKTRVTILTATLPQWQRNAFALAYSPDWSGENEPVEFPSTLEVHYPETSSSDPRESGISEPLGIPTKMAHYKISVRLTETEDPVPAHTEWVLQNRTKTPLARLGVIVNTIDRAQAVAKSLIDSGENVIVLHSRMTARHRKDAAELLEREIGKNGSARSISVVGTQAIEASLDIDLDAISTDLAPSPSLVQRAGRGWRRVDPSRSERVPGMPNLELQIVRTTSDFGHAPYQEALLRRTWAFLQERSVLNAPQDLQKFVETSAVRLDDIEDEVDLTEVAGISRKQSKGATTAINFARVLDSDALFKDFNELTRFSHQRDRDELHDAPQTRDIEYESSKIIFTNSSLGEIPGGWTGSLSSLQAVESTDISMVRMALAAGFPVSSTMRKELIKHLSFLEAGPAALIGYYAGPLPQGFKYDVKVGLLKV